MDDIIAANLLDAAAPSASFDIIIPLLFVVVVVAPKKNRLHICCARVIFDCVDDGGRESKQRH
jgi:hypothetical protein